MSLYDLNLSAIAERNGRWHEKVTEVEGKKEQLPNSLEGVESNVTRDGNFAVTIIVGDRKVRLNSGFRPMEEAERWAKQYSFQNVTNVVTMFGLGNGYFCKAIQKKLTEEGHFFIYEPSPDIFFHALEEYDLRDLILDERIVIGVEGINEFDVHIALKEALNITNLRNHEICVHPQYDEIFKDSWSEFKEDIKNCVSHAVINHNTMMYFAKVSMTNTLQNIKYLRQCNTFIELREVIPTDLPVVVVAAGPSVEESIEGLRKMKGKGIIIAVDRILDFLLDREIVPDFVVSVDPNKLITNFSKRDDVAVPLFCFMDSKAGIMERHKGKKIFCNVGSFIGEIFEKIKGYAPLVPTSASVATVAFSIAVQIGFRKIVLVGQDLAYSGSTTHAGGITSNPYSSDVIMVEGVDGNKVPSRYDWQEFIMWYEDVIKLYPQIEVIDTKTKGAKIMGTKNMSLEEAVSIENDKCLDVQDVLEQIPPTFSDAEFLEVVEFLKENFKILDQIKKKAQDGVRVCCDLIDMTKKGRLQSRAVDRSLEKVRSINEFILEQPIYVFMDAAVKQNFQEKFIDSTSLGTDEVSNSLKVFDTTRSMFHAIDEVVSELKPVLKEAMDSFIEE
ncbi:motility associated factor glycosyltransferase family protein [Anaeromicropila populeti]|uniref:Uncharacterized conserved protein n=1 Tax=Anaeromicropila populeti TaxID=37658 RepID=A0A1I6HWL7_9FIRM|nr:6-hydroxymethylpterin diphosphokinase MptE-like protein [Anaeromicropila populeti]SFR58851.1 Uncharacterized conserved protein [Anaeromicropila populeti]